MTTQAARTETTPGEALFVVGVCFGWAIYASLAAVATGFSGTGGFSDASFIGLVITEAIAATIALGVLRLRRYDIAGLVPQPTWQGSAIGLGLVLLVWVVNALVTAPFMQDHAEQPIEAILHATKVSLPVVALVALVNGTFEEVFLLGFLQRGLRRHGTSISLGVTLLVRMLYHLYQGPLGALSIVAFGAVQGAYFARWQRLWPPVLVHIICDIVPFLF